MKQFLTIGFSKKKKTLNKTKIHRPETEVIVLNRVFWKLEISFNFGSFHLFEFSFVFLAVNVISVLHIVSPSLSIADLNKSKENKLHANFMK
jgi:hypothetical protein